MLLHNSGAFAPRECGVNLRRSSRSRLFLGASPESIFRWWLWIPGPYEPRGIDCKGLIPEMTRAISTFSGSDFWANQHAPMTDTAAVSQPFQAEVSELLHLMVHSVYSETDIFLRELISNASDACDKLRYEAIAKPELIGDGEPPKIRIMPDKKADTLTVADNGIGMDRQELIDNLGTIARSGTKAFVAKPDRGQGRRRPDRPVRRRLLFRLHGRRPHRRHQPPRRHERGLDLVVVRRRRFRSRAGRRGGRQARRARHRDRAASEGRREEISRDLRDRAHRRRLFRQHPVSDRAGRRRRASRARSIRRARCGSGRNPS